MSRQTFSHRRLRLGPSSASALLEAEGLTEPRTYQLPDQSGTLMVEGGKRIDGGAAATVYDAAALVIDGGGADG